MIKLRFKAHGYISVYNGFIDGQVVQVKNGEELTCSEEASKSLLSTFPDNFELAKEDKKEEKQEEKKPAEKKQKVIDRQLKKSTHR